MFFNIEVERLRRHMTKANMASHLAVSTEELDNWISRREAIPAEKLRGLARLFKGCSIDYLLCEW